MVPYITNWAVIGQTFPQKTSTAILIAQRLGMVAVWISRFMFPYDNIINFCLLSKQKERPVCDNTALLYKPVLHTQTHIETLITHTGASTDIGQLGINNLVQNEFPCDTKRVLCIHKIYFTGPMISYDEYSSSSKDQGIMPSGSSL